MVSMVSHHCELLRSGDLSWGSASAATSSCVLVVLIWLLSLCLSLSRNVEETHRLQVLVILLRLVDLLREGGV